MRMVFGLISAWILIAMPARAVDQHAPLLCYKPGETISLRARDILDASPHYGARGYASVVKFSFTKDMARRLSRFEERNTDKLGATTFLNQLLIPLHGNVSSFVKETLWFTISRLGLPDTLALSRAIRERRSDVKQQDEIIMTDFTIKDQISLAPDEIRTMRFYSVGLWVHIQPRSESGIQQLVEKIGEKKQGYRCFVAGQEAASWRLDRSQRPAIFQFQLKE